MSNKVYDRLKNIALIIIPALTMLWTTIGETWNIPYTTQVAATISAVGVFLGASLKISTHYYNKNKEEKKDA